MKNKKTYPLIMTLIMAGLFLVLALTGTGTASLPALGADAFFPLLVDNFGTAVNTPTPTLTATPTRSATPRPACTEVSIVDFSFSPDSVTIKPGGCVKWVNNGSFTHTSTSDTGVWNSGSLTSGQSFTFTFNSPGTYPYFCAIHPSMTGKVVVK